MAARPDPRPSAPAGSAAARFFLAALAAAGAAAITACGGGPNDPAVFAPTPALVVEPGVTEATGIPGGTCQSFTDSQPEGTKTPYVGLRLTVPDGSPVLQFVAPKADFVVVSENSRLEVVGSPCQLSAGEGTRTFWAQQVLTAPQYNTLERVIVTRVYQ